MGRCGKVGSPIDDILKLAALVGERGEQRCKREFIDAGNCAGGAGWLIEAMYICSNRLNLLIKCQDKRLREFSTI